MPLPPVNALEGGAHSLAIANNGKTYVFDGRGVADLFRLYTKNPEILYGASVADKVVGKGAAALMALGGVKALHALVISDAALALLKREGVEVTCDRIVPAIINRAGTGPCPVESLCKDCATPRECFPLIEVFLNEVSSSPDMKK